MNRKIPKPLGAAGQFGELVIELACIEFERDFNLMEIAQTHNLRRAVPGNKVETLVS